VSQPVNESVVETTFATVTTTVSVEPHECECHAQLAAAEAECSRLALENVALAAKARMVADIPRTLDAADASDAEAKLARIVKAWDVVDAEAKACMTPCPDTWVTLRAAIKAARTP
jgi:hypothetical protein